MSSAESYGELVQIIYSSRSLLAGTTAEIAAGIADILAVSHRNNARDDVTGALFFNGRSFAQTLEGKSLAVADCYAHILKDKRHTDIRLLRHEYVTARCFEGWAMAYVEGPCGLGFTISPGFLHATVAKNDEAAAVLELMRHVMAYP
ncbi:hypothetical protein GGD83_000985 [Rhodoblastus sphagnicola]|uniref:BLUF domain-containing protein n=1 Tax=Rhodoblastus sphagnicola TaxID=333368 RepID=UPI001304CFE5|nr:BLUF domain-containing protein [Rhodoblastus sphagnicola]MBB4197199.1 hypothetical protein [Rhodoblastus sphagnicola]